MRLDTTIKGCFYHFLDLYVFVSGDQGVFLVLRYIYI